MRQDKKKVRYVFEQEENQVVQEKAKLIEVKSADAIAKDKRKSSFPKCSSGESGQSPEYQDNHGNIEEQKGEPESILQYVRGMVVSAPNRQLSLHSEMGYELVPLMEGDGIVHSASEHVMDKQNPIIHNLSLNNNIDAVGQNSSFPSSCGNSSFGNYSFHKASVAA